MLKVTQLKWGHKGLGTAQKDNTGAKEQGQFQLNLWHPQETLGMTPSTELGKTTTWAPQDVAPKFVPPPKKGRLRENSN